MLLVGRLTLLVAVAVGLLAGTAIAQPEHGRSPWESFGTFEINWTESDGPLATRMIHFSNGEFMGEIEGKGTRKQVLQVLPSGLLLYSGLTGDESARPGANNPFMFMDYGFAYPAQALLQAYPSGANSVPNVETETHVILERRLPATLTALRESDNRVRFRLSLRSDRDLSMQGIWDGNLLRPLPDDLQLTSWRHDSSVKITTLGEARSLSGEHGRSK